jgi:dipeptidyl aminopeptidase/acylaminoacyl peptidase
MRGGMVGGMTTTAPYGTWVSPVTSELLVAETVMLLTPTTSGESVHWVEGRPSEGGVSALVSRGPGGDVADVLPEGFSARTLVHEYGGLCHAAHESVVYFSNFADQRIYRIDPGTAPRPITPAPPTARSLRYADFKVTSDGRHIVCVRERHEGDKVTNDLVAVDTDGSRPPRVLAGGHDFFAAPAVSADGHRLAWIAWDHPRMSWDGTELYEADLGEDLEVTATRVVAGGPAESVLQPGYDRDGRLHFLSDRTGWWNLYRDAEDGAVALAPREGEFARAAWWFGDSNYAFCGDGSIAAVWSESGRSHLGVIPPGGGELSEIPLRWTSLSSLRASAEGVVVLAGSAIEAASLVRIALPSGEASVIKRSHPSLVEREYLSEPEGIEFPTENGLAAHALYYAPVNRDFSAPAGELPPLVVSSHGGPTASCSSVLDYGIQFWTSRGFAVVDVNYGGSTGYGRAYRDRLKDAWGIVDVDDCVNAARHLASSGRADPERLLIRGGSAGGYTTLSAATFRDVFAAGASHFGVADLAALARDTHKFESRYLDGLVGPWPEREDLYGDRSPICHTDQLRTPLILFQGLEDEIVPPAQAEMMVDALRKNGIPFAYLAYEGEQHGFRKAESIIRTAEAELYFYGRVLGFEPAGDIDPVDIENAGALA